MNALLSSLTSGWPVIAGCPSISTFSRFTCIHIATSAVTHRLHCRGRDGKFARLPTAVELRTCSIFTSPVLLKFLNQSSILRMGRAQRRLSACTGSHARRTELHRPELTPHHGFLAAGRLHAPQ